MHPIAPCPWLPRHDDLIVGYRQFWQVLRAYHPIALAFFFRSYHQRLLVQSKLICCDISCDITLIKDVCEHVFSTVISFPSAPCMEHLPKFTTKLPKRRNIYHRVIWSIWMVGGFNPSEKNISQLGLLSHILWKIKAIFQTTNQIMIVKLG